MVERALFEEASIRPQDMRRLPTVLLALLAGAASLHALERWSVHAVALRPILGDGVFLAVRAALGVSVAVEVVLLVRVLGRRGAREGFGALRAALLVLGAACVVYVALVHPYKTIVLRATLGVAAGLWALLLLARPWLARAVPRGVRVRAELLAWGILLPLLGAELALRAVAAAWPSPLLLPASPGAAEELAARREPPERSWYGGRLNSRGYLDTELPDPPPRPLVAVVGDSFSFGPVPWRDHYTTVCERELGFGELYNVGAPGIGPAAYLELLRSEVLALAPDAVVVALFLGNDVPAEPPGRGPGFPRTWLDRDLSRLWQLVRRLLLLVREGRRGSAEPLAPPPGAPGAGEPEDETATLHEEFPWLADPLLEEPGFSRETFLEIEARRARAIAAEDAVDPTRTLGPYLERMVAAAGDTPVLFLLIPDEFQVDDVLWEELVRTLPDVTLERDRAQRLLCAWLDERGWPYLDLLTVLRAVPPLEDGRPHVYHLQDTHLNRRGSQVVGRALAERLRPLLRR